MPRWFRRTTDCRKALEGRATSLCSSSQGTSWTRSRSSPSWVRGSRSSRLGTGSTLSTGQARRAWRSSRPTTPGSLLTPTRRKLPRGPPSKRKARTTRSTRNSSWLAPPLAPRPTSTIPGKLRELARPRKAWTSLRAPIQEVNSLANR